MLDTAKQTCTAALAALAIPADPVPDLRPSVLHADVLSLLALLRASTTKLGLAFTPSSPSRTAAVTPLTDVSNHISALSHCVRLYHPIYGLTVRHEATSLARDIIQSVSSLLVTLSDIDADLTSSDHYLVRVAAVHHIIDCATAPGGFSLDNIAAVRKKWVQDHDSLEDGLSEVAEMAEDPSSSCDNPDFEDDGWHEFGVPSNKTMNPDEIQVTRKTHTILRLSTLLHGRISKDLLSSRLSDPTIQNLDHLSPLSSAILVASDDLISALYPPQDPTDILAELASFADVLSRVRSTLLPILAELALSKQLEATNLDSQPKVVLVKWFEACLNQIDKAVLSLQDTLKSHGQP